MGGYCRKEKWKDVEEFRTLVKKHPKNIIIKAKFVTLLPMKKKLEEVKERSSEYDPSSSKINMEGFSAK